MKVATSLAQAHTLAQQAEVKRWCKERGLPVPEFEVMFAPARKWRFDVAWVHQRVAMEIDGGVWTQGKHARGVGILIDHEKQNTAAGLGWRLLRATPSTLFTAATAKQRGTRLRPRPAGDLTMAPLAPLRGLLAALATLMTPPPGGGGFNNALSRLRTLELIRGRGELQASEDLF